MKSIRIIFLVVLSVILISGSCGRPDLLVINDINTDGSVNRRLIMTYDKDDFDLKDMQVPADSTWVLNKTFEVSEKGDTLWTLTAERHFASVDELNNTYNDDTGSNDHLLRWAEFSKKFRWFNTVYYYSENVGKVIEAYPPEDFLDQEYLNLFYMPEKIFNDYRYGEDSLKYKAMIDSLEDKKDEWVGRCIVKAAIIELDSLLLKTGDKSIDINLIKGKEEELGDIILGDVDVEVAIDSLFGKGYYTNNKILIDSSLKNLENKIDMAMRVETYLTQTKMPGELVGTNGYIDTDGAIIWELNSEVIFAKDYSMWAQSTVSNLWAWIVSALFVIFVVISIVFRSRR